MHKLKKATRWKLKNWEKSPFDYLEFTTNKASGGDGIQAELFQILKDDAVKILHTIC